MHRTVVAALLVAAFGSAASPGRAAPILPVGAGAWSSTNVSSTGECGRVPAPADTSCTVQADSLQTTTAPGEKCTNATYVVTQPVVIGTNFGCNVTFEATLTTTGGGDVGVDAGGGEVDPYDVEIEAGACAGYALSGAKVTVHDGAAGDYEVTPRVVVTNAAWKFEGSLVGVNAVTGSVYVLHVVGKIAPACVLVKSKKTVTLTFRGVFSGSYEIL